MLDQALGNMGQGFFQNRALQQQNAEQDLNRQMRQQMLNDSLDVRSEYNQQRSDALQANAQARQDDASARNQLAAVAQQRQDLADKQTLLQTMIQLNAGGQLTDTGRDKFNTWLGNDPHFGQTGIQLQSPPMRPAPNVGQNSAAAALQQADRYYAIAAGLPDNDPNKQRYQQWGQMLQNSIDPSAYQTVTTKDAQGNATTRKVPVAGAGLANDFSTWMQQRAGAQGQQPGLPLPPAMQAPSSTANLNPFSPPPDQ